MPASGSWCWPRPCSRAWTCRGGRCSWSCGGSSCRGRRYSWCGRRRRCYGCRCGGCGRGCCCRSCRRRWCWRRCSRGCEAAHAYDFVSLRGKQEVSSKRINAAPRQDYRVPKRRSCMFPATGSPFASNEAVATVPYVVRVISTLLGEILVNPVAQKQCLWARHQRSRARLPI